MADATEKSAPGVHKQILDTFIKNLQNDGVSASITERVRVAVESEEISEAELKKALFSDDAQV
ncbi:MAG: hypothetical protein KGI71_03310 [Patescibacteria group bacterium]|nr:hypothetical protein [Patescibacteria group bacterium]